MDDIKTLKAFMEGFTFYAGQEVALVNEDGTVTTINADATANYSGPFVLASTDPTSPTQANTNNWIFDILTLNQGANNDVAGSGLFRCYNQQRIDLTGMLQLGTALSPLGSASQRAGVPQLPSDWYFRSNVSRNSLTYMRDFTIWSVEPLTEMDLNLLWSDGIVRQSATPNMPNFVNSTGSMTTTQMLSSQSRLFVSDTSLSGRIGWLRELFNQQGGMGETAASPHVYVTRVVSGQFDTAPKTIDGIIGTSFSADKFWISIPPSWEILNVGMIEPDDLEYLTYMQRSVLAPVGRST